MNQKILAIDYLRALSILAIILLHIIWPISGMPLTEYSSIPTLFALRDYLNLCVITLVTCSGFSLYLSTKDWKFGPKGLASFYKKRFKRLLLPWVNYVIVSILVYGIVSYFSPGFKSWLLHKYPFVSVANYAGIPFAWVALKWIIILLSVLTLLFPILRYFYQKRPIFIGLLFGVYVASSVLLQIYPANLQGYPGLDVFRMPVLLWVISFVSGWSLVYIFGFSLEKLYNDQRFMKKDMKITFISIILFIGVHIAYKVLGYSTLLDMNKFPPSPYYITLGIAVTLVLLSFFISFRPLFRKLPQRFLEFFSINSYWIYLWSLLILFFSNYIFSYFPLHPYIKLLLEFTFNCIVLTMIVLAERHIKIDIYVERQNF